MCKSKFYIYIYIHRGVNKKKKIIKEATWDLKEGE